MWCSFLLPYRQLGRTELCNEVTIRYLADAFRMTRKKGSEQVICFGSQAAYLYSPSECLEALKSNVISVKIDSSQSAILSHGLTEHREGIVATLVSSEVKRFQGVVAFQSYYRRSSDMTHSRWKDANTM